MLPLWCSYVAQVARLRRQTVPPLEMQHGRMPHQQGPRISEKDCFDAESSSHQGMRDERLYLPAPLHICVFR